MYAFVTCIIIAILAFDETLPPSIEKRVEGELFRSRMTVAHEFSRHIWRYSGYFSNTWNRARALEVTYTGTTFGTTSSDYGCCVSEAGEDHDQP